RQSGPARPFAPDATNRPGRARRLRLGGRESFSSSMGRSGIICPYLADPRRLGTLFHRGSGTVFEKPFPTPCGNLRALLNREGFHTENDSRPPVEISLSRPVRVARLRGHAD